MLIQLQKIVEPYTKAINNEEQDVDRVKPRRENAAYIRELNFQKQQKSRKYKINFNNINSCID